MGNTISMMDNLGNNIGEPNKDHAHILKQLDVGNHRQFSLYQILIHSNVP